MKISGKNRLSCHSKYISRFYFIYISLSLSSVYALSFVFFFLAIGSFSFYRTLGIGFIHGWEIYDWQDTTEESK